MQLCTVTKVTGPDSKEHFCIVGIGQPNWPLALCGLTSGPNVLRSELEAKLFADAPAMLDMLEVLNREFGNINPNFPIAPGKMNELRVLVDRATSMCLKHQKISKGNRPNPSSGHSKA